jgi:hypothetical protein
MVSAASNKILAGWMKSSVADVVGRFTLAFGSFER